MLCHIAKLVKEGFFRDGGRIRGIPVTIGGCKYVPEFKRLLVAFYEGEDMSVIAGFMKKLLEEFLSLFWWNS